jgi:hypothetical protein
MGLLAVRFTRDQDNPTAEVLFSKHGGQTDASAPRMAFFRFRPQTRKRIRPPRSALAQNGECGPQGAALIFPLAADLFRKSAFRSRE